MKAPNRVSKEGIAMGVEMARLCDVEVPKLIAMGEWEEDERCASCAFRAGTVPNGCSQTQMDVLKCVMEKQAFFCHATPVQGTKVCAGWFASMQAVKNSPPMECPWPMSPVEDTPEAHAEYERQFDKCVESNAAMAPRPVCPPSLAKACVAVASAK